MKVRRVYGGNSDNMIDNFASEHNCIAEHNFLGIGLINIVSKLTSPLESTYAKMYRFVMMQLVRLDYYPSYHFGPICSSLLI